MAQTTVLHLKVYRWILTQNFVYSFPTWIVPLSLDIWTLQIPEHLLLLWWGLNTKFLKERLPLLNCRWQCCTREHIMPRKRNLRESEDKGFWVYSNWDLNKIAWDCDNLNHSLPLRTSSRSTQQCSLITSILHFFTASNMGWSPVILSSAIKTSPWQVSKV